MWRSKSVIYLFLSVALLAGCNEIDEADRLLPYDPVAPKPDDDPDGPTSYVRNILLEEFTGQACPNCPEGTAEAHRLQEVYAPRLVLVSIHAGSFSVGSEFVTEAGTAYWERLYPGGDTQGYPAAMVNRGRVSTGYQAEWSSLVAAAAQLTASFSLSMQSEYDADSRTLTVVSTLQKTMAEERQTKLLLLLTENGIVNYQASATEGFILEYEHNHVLRGAIGDKDATPNYWGTEVEIPSLEETTVTSGPYRLDDGWVPENMAVVGLVYDASTFEVLQVEEIQLIPLPEEEQP